MLKYLFIFFILFFITDGNANNKDKIIKNLNQTRNLDFNFEQNINGKIENEIVQLNIQKKYFVKMPRVIIKF